MTHLTLDCLHCQHTLQDQGGGWWGGSNASGSVCRCPLEPQVKQEAVEKAFHTLNELQLYVDTCMVNMEEQSSVLVSPGSVSDGSAERKRKRPSGSGEVRLRVNKQFEDHMLPGTPTQVSQTCLLEVLSHSLSTQLSLP